MMVLLLLPIQSPVLGSSVSVACEALSRLGRSLLLSQVYGAYHGLYRAAQTRPALQLRLLACLREVLARFQQHDELGFMRQVRALAPAAGPACARVVWRRNGVAVCACARVLTFAPFPVWPFACRARVPSRWPRRPRLHRHHAG